MPQKKKQSKAQQRVALTALKYDGPIVAMPRVPRDDDYVTVVGLVGQGTRGSSTGAPRMRALFRASSSGGVPSTMTGDFFLSVADAVAFGTFAGEFGSFRVLGLKITVVTQLSDSTDGFHGKPIESSVLRENMTTAGKLIDTPGFEVHPVSTGPNTFSREMRMEGTDEAEWVDCANAYTAISPQPTIIVQFPDDAAPIRETIYFQWRVQFRGRV